MKVFRKVTSHALALDRPDVDTDQIIPKQFLKRIERSGFGEFLFFDWRKDPTFELNRPEAKGARILVAGRNFGCGSSRENAVWALMDAGIRVVIAPSFGDIFFNNSFKNGLLPIVLPQARCAELRAALARNPGAKLVVDLEAQTVTGPVGVDDGFGTDRIEIDPFPKQLLLSGMDDITFTLSQADNIAAFEKRFAAEMPWV